MSESIKYIFGIALGIIIAFAPTIPSFFLESIIDESRCQRPSGGGFVFGKCYSGSIDISGSLNKAREISFLFFISLPAGILVLIYFFDKLIKNIRFSISNRK
jgi:hypothetical protein